MHLSTRFRPTPAPVVAALNALPANRVGTAHVVDGSLLGEGLRPGHAFSEVFDQVGR